MSMKGNDKIALIELALMRSDTLREWYRENQQVTSDTFTPLNVNDYTSTGMGHTADAIILDGIEYGVITTSISNSR